MKKMILIMMMAMSFIKADIIFEQYFYNQELSEIRNLTKIDKPNFLYDMKNIETYEDEKGTMLVFNEDKLKYAIVVTKSFVLKEKIEMLIKNGIRLKKILFMTNKDKLDIENVGSLLVEINNVKEMGSILDSKAQADMLFQKDKLAVIMTYLLIVERNGSGCNTCDEVKGIPIKEKEYLRFMFTETQS